MENEIKENIGEPHVKIFNKDVDSWKKKEKFDRKNHYHYYCNHYRERDGGGIFGLAILFAGMVLLLNTFGVVSKDVWNYIWPFWPAFLVLIGIKILAGFNRFLSFLVFLLAFAVFSIIVAYGLIHVGSPLIQNLPPEFINFINQIK